MVKGAFKRAVVCLITAEARLVLKKYRPYIVAVTGSVGKTSTKDAIYAVLAGHGLVRKSEKSFNSDVGVPLTILGQPNGWNNPVRWLHNLGSGLLLLLMRRPYPNLLVLEVGADRPGDIKKIASWLNPDVVVVTRFAPVPVHVEYFGTPDAVVNEKAELVRALKDNGTLILSADDEKAGKFKALAHGRRVLTYGFTAEASVRGEREAVFYTDRNLEVPEGMSMKIKTADEHAEIKISGSIGRQLLYAALAAAAVGLSFDMKLSQTAKRFKNFEGPLGRMRIIEGQKGSLIIDDTYNSSPVAAREALDALASLPAKGRKIAVLGDMLELGKYSVTEHKNLGAYAASHADMLITVGVRARDCADGALQNGMDGSRILQFDESRQTGKALEGLIKTGDAILIKGSQGVRMERVVESLMAHPEEKQRLLVRQESEWKNR